jgi:hypothetical protein
MCVRRVQNSAKLRIGVSVKLDWPVTVRYLEPLWYAGIHIT